LKIACRGAGGEGDLAVERRGSGMAVGTHPGREDRRKDRNLVEAGQEPQDQEAVVSHSRAEVQQEVRQEEAHATRRYSHQ
jgi:hypothetical protein